MEPHDYVIHQRSGQALRVPSGRIEQPEAAQLAMDRERSNLGCPTAGPNFSWGSVTKIGQAIEIGQAVDQSQTAGQKPEKALHPPRMPTESSRPSFPHLWTGFRHSYSFRHIRK